MANAGLDQNNRPTLLAASSSNGSVIVQVQANPSTHTLRVSDATGGSDNGNNSDNAMLDENSVPVATALASDGSGRIIELYADPVTNLLLINSN